MKNINLILAIGDWNRIIFHKNKSKLINFKLVSSKEELYLIKKKYFIDNIYIIHWNYKISNNFLKKYNCISFHMTDLPYGRGGSPLQNLIIRGFTSSVLSAFVTSPKMDAGDILIKRKFNLKGKASDILMRVSKLAFSMIFIIESRKILPIKQKGQIIKFKRRLPEMSKIQSSFSFQKLYDFIRMLDAPIYPKAFIKNKNYTFEFYDVKKYKNKLICKTIIKKNV
jgi:methionyl-tRNA formyltransferase